MIISYMIYIMFVLSVGCLCIHHHTKASKLLMYCKATSLCSTDVFGTACKHVNSTPDRAVCSCASNGIGGYPWRNATKTWSVVRRALSGPCGRGWRVEGRSYLYANTVVFHASIYFSTNHRESKTASLFSLYEMNERVIKLLWILRSLLCNSCYFHKL